MSPARLLSIPAALLALATGCATEFDDPDAIEPRCGTCTFNSPRINDYYFPELHLGGSPNFDGVSLVGLRHPSAPGVTYTLSTDIREALVALDASSNVRASGAELAGWQLVLEKNNVEMIGTIEAYDDTEPGWDDTHRPMTVYAISFEVPNDPAGNKNVCPRWYLSPSSTVLTIIRGQTYDRDEKRVDEIDPDWVTFACADEAAYKAKALGYQQSRNFAATGMPASRARQDATLKMITADYCGIGHSFTGQGTAVAWENTAQTVTSNESNIEAMWDADGAICLDAPRYASIEDVKSTCPEAPPPCSSIDPDDYDVEWVSYKVTP